MTATVDVDVTELTSIDPKKTPPCECVTRVVLFRRLVRERQCGKPSTARVRVHCLACGKTEHTFLCRLHTRWFLTGLSIRCRFCGEVGQCISTES